MKRLIPQSSMQDMIVPKVDSKVDRNGTAANSAHILL